MVFILMMPVYVASYIFLLSKKLNLSAWFDSKNDRVFNNYINGVFVVTLYQAIIFLGILNIAQCFGLANRFDIDKIFGIAAITAVSILNYVYFVIKEQGDKFEIFFKSTSIVKRVSIITLSAILFVIGLAGLVVCAPIY